MTVLVIIKDNDIDGLVSNMTYIIVFTGPAGSGKTTLSKYYGDWLRNNLFMRVCNVNMDPGVEFVPYKPCFDIREFITIKDIMKSYGLGPNGAFMKAVELMLKKMDDIMGTSPFRDPYSYDVIIIDTPGQLEAFIFRPETRNIMRRIQRLGRTVVAYLIDSTSIMSPGDAITTWFLGIMLHVKIGLDVIPVITKIDTIDEARKKIIEELIVMPEKLIKEMPVAEGLISEIMPDLVNIAVKTRGAYRPVLVSIKDPMTIEDLHFILHEAACSCGDLT